MAGFSVEDHRAWRGAGDGGPQQPAVTGRAPGQDPRAAAGPPAVEPDHRLGDLGFLAVPARLHDAVFGRFRSGAVYHVLRFLLIVAIVLLVVGGVQAESPVVHEVGQFRAATPYTTLDAYPTPQFTYSYQIDIAQGQSPGPSAYFDVSHGTVHVPSFSGGDHVYALYVNLLRIDDVEPVMLVKAPGGAYRTLQPESDDGLRMTFAPIRIEEPGRLGILLASVEGRGNVQVQLAIASAPVEVRELFSVARVAPIGGGAVLGMVLLGAYAPGATLLRERRHRLDGVMEEVYVENVQDQPSATDRGHARINWGRSGVMAWKRPGDNAAEELADLPGSGWVIRLD